MNDKWKSLIFLKDNYKKMVDIYFKNKSGEFIINKNVLEINFDDWGKEYFYIESLEDLNKEASKMESNKNIYYDIKHNDFKTIHSIALLIQIGNWNVFKKMEDYIKNFNNININIYFFIIDQYAIPENIDYLKYNYKECVIASCDNRGMDIGPFLLNLHYLKKQQYQHDYIFKIHTKSCDYFRNETLNKLMKTHDNIIQNIKTLSDNMNGIFAGNILYKYKDFKEAFQSNLYHIQNLIKYFYNEDVIYDNLEFVGGTMFIAKMQIFNVLTIYKIMELYKQLNDIDTLDYYWYSVFYRINVNDRKRIYYDYINNKENRYPNNLNYSFKTKTDGLRDSMIEHAIERVIGYMCKKEGLLLIS